MRLVLPLALSLLLFAAAGSAAPLKGPQAMVAAANPQAVEAGLAVLRRGGNAMDAAVAIQATLGLVEPQSSGVGGGAFMVWYDPRTHAVTSYDGREIAPAGATPDMFLNGGKPMTFSQAVLSGRSAGVPGAIAMLFMAQKEHGHLAWKSLFGDAEALAESGFLVGPRLADERAFPVPQNSAPDVIAYFKDESGAPIKAGERLKNPAYAATLRLIAAEGPDAILKGKIARDIVARLAQDPIPSSMTLADLASYSPHKAEALCAPYRQWEVCAPNPPSGGVAVLEGLGILQRTDISTRGPTDPQAWFELAQAERLMYADDLRYNGDPAFVEVPAKGLLDPTYLDARAKLIGDTAGPPPAPGHPPGAPNPGPDATKEPGGTSSFVVVDRWGQVVAMTTTVESIFGDGRMVDGFFLNNQLTDFSFSPLDANGAPAANAVAPLKRPRSAMSPTIVLDGQGRFLEAVGSAGGPAIISYVLKTLIATLDWHMSMQAAVGLPNLIAHGDHFTAETAKFAPEVLNGMIAHGLDPKPVQYEESGLTGVLVRADGSYAGGADPRREGVALSY